MFSPSGPLAIASRYSRKLSHFQSMPAFIAARGMSSTPSIKNMR
jgi:hypothetical protein